MTPITLTAEEYVILASLQGGKHLIGVENPFQGYLDEEIRTRWQEISLELIEKGCLKREGEEKLEISGDVAPIIETCVTPQVSFLVNAHNAKKEGYQQTLHVSASHAVQQNLDPHGKYHLRPLAEISEINEVLVDLFQLEDQSRPPGEEITLDTRALSENTGQAAVSDSPISHKKLVEYGVAEEDGKSLLEAFADCHVNGTIIATAWRGSSWETADLGFLVTQKGIWQVKPRKTRVRFVPISAEEGRQKIKRLLNRMLPVRL